MREETMALEQKHWIVIALVIAVLFCMPPGMVANEAATGQKQAPNASVVAVVDGKEITEPELRERIRGELLRLETQIYEARRNGVDELISEYLLEQAAKARGISADQLLKQEVDGKVSGVTPKDVEDFYTANQSRIRKPLDEVRGQILNYIQQARLNDARREYLKGLRDKAQVQVFLKPPVVDVSAEGSPLKGPQDAPITIVEFSDFQCPFCKQVLSILSQVLDQYPGRIKLAFRDFPIPSIHPHAEKAAEAAHCAEEQGKFWEYHDLLFAKQDELPTEKFVDYARSLGLEAAAFQACIESHRQKDRVEQNHADGMKAGVSGTPAFFINGRLLSGAQPLEAFKTMIDEELERLGPQAQR
jgi:protein-disulfide isomerase